MTRVGWPSAWSSFSSRGFVHYWQTEYAPAEALMGEAAEAIQTIAAGIADETLRDGFLRAEPVREVLEAAPGT